MRRNGGGANTAFSRGARRRFARRRARRAGFGIAGRVRSPDRTDLKCNLVWAARFEIGFG
jgi:hypothetical protein